MAPVVTLAGASSDARPTPFRARLDLVELALLAERSGSPALPIDLDPASAPDAESLARLHDRLAGGSPSATDRAQRLLREALDTARESPGPAAARLAGLGLLDEVGTPVAEVRAALAALAAPEALLVVDVALAPVGGRGPGDRLRSWFAVVGDRVSQLATASGVAYELASYDVAALAGALARALDLDHDLDHDLEPADQDDLPEHFDLPFELFCDGTEAVRRNRSDVLAELVSLAPRPVCVAGAPVGPAEAAALVTAIESGTRGRLRVLATAPQGAQDAVGRRSAGVVSWLLVGDRWHALTPLVIDHVPTLRVTAVQPRDLARQVAPLLAQIVGATS